MKRLCVVLVAMVPGLMLAHGCASFPIKLEKPDWPVREDGTPWARCEDLDPSGNVRDRCCVTEGPVVVSDDGIPRGTWEIRDNCEPIPSPTPEPTPEPDPGPGPTPEPDPEPTPDPTPPPPPAGTCPPITAFRCFEGDDTALAGVEVSAAERRVIASRPGYLVEVHERGQHLRAKIRTPDPDAEPDLRRWTEDVAAELRRAGYCAYSGDPGGSSPDEILIVVDDPEGLGDAEQWDLAKCGAVDPDKRYCVGSDLEHQPFDCVLRDSGPDLGSGGPGDPGPEDEPESEPSYCTVTGHGNADGPLRFPSMLAACQFGLDYAADAGHTERHTSGGEVWFHDAGRGWYRRATCERYDIPDPQRGRVINTYDWFGVECFP